MKTDVAIIGAGIVGCSAAYFLAKQGLRVVVCEKNPGVGLEASGRNAGGVRQHGRKGDLLLAMEGVRLWESLSEELQSDLEYEQTGNLYVALDETAVQACERDIRWEHDHGLTEVRILTAAECQKMAPGVTNRAIAGKFCPTDGVANPMMVMSAFAGALRKLGVKIELNTVVTGLLQQGSKVCGIKTETEEVEADAVLNAAGPWAAQFNEMVGCTTPITPGRSQLLITERISRDLVRQWVTIRGFGYMRPTASGNLVMGVGGGWNEHYSTHIDINGAALQAACWNTFFPWLRDISIIRIFAGITEYTPDKDPYIGVVPNVSGMYVAAGFHAHGFCPGPMAGKTVADLIMGKEPNISLKPFKPDRFDLDIKAGKPLSPINYTLDRVLSRMSKEINGGSH
jgi:sarcosine oxidase subunit beta